MRCRTSKIVPAGGTRDLASKGRKEEEYRRNEPNQIFEILQLFTLFFTLIASANVTFGRATAVAYVTPYW